MYKAPDVVIDATAACVRDGLDLELVLLGDGKHRAELEARASGHGLGDRVRFRGSVPMGAPVRAELDRADLFVLPSRADTVPKAMLEAMARALPCIGSTVGGFAELVPAEDLVSPNDAGALAATIRAVVTDPARMAAMSARNLATAREYHEDILQARRIDFYRVVRERTEQWIGGKR
jgi:glycosyltransferase involved in cell wall biosynthesis